MFLERFSVNTKKISSYKKNKKQKNEESISDFNPYLNKKSQKYKIKCFVCKKEKFVAFKPIKNIPAICNDCIIDIEARRLLDTGGIRKTKKLKCKWCGKDFYALNESFLFCDECYDNFSHEIKARRKGLKKFNCDKCGKEFWFLPKLAQEKREKNKPLLCQDCLTEDKKQKKKEKSKKRIEETKERLKKIKKNSNGN